MRLHILMLSALLTFAAGLVLAQQAQPVPKLTEAQERTGAADVQQTTDPAAKAILRRLEAAGKVHKAIRADVEYEVMDRMLGDTEKRTGWVAFQRRTETTPDKFRVTFDTLQQGSGRPTRNQVDYIFDGQWLTVAKHRIKELTRFQIAQPGQRVEALRIGHGPFPVPFGQDTDEVLQYLTAQTRRPRSSDPPGTDYIQFTPLRKRRGALNFVKLEMWVDRKTSLPVKIRSVDENKKVTSVVFKNIQTAAVMKPEWFTFVKPVDWPAATIERVRRSTPAKPGNATPAP